jgi:hypothetical protein
MGLNGNFYLLNNSDSRIEWVICLRPPPGQIVKIFSEPLNTNQG